MASTYNIKQITNYDLNSASTETITISVPERSTTPDEDGKYPINFIDENVEYKTALKNVEILKLGYCCSLNGIIYPIFLQINGNYELINIGKQGMYEFQPETWKDLNSEDPQKKTSDIICTAVKVPANINFTLEYVIEE